MRFEAWAGGDAAAAQTVRDAEHRGDAAKRELLNALREAFITPLEPEDVFTLSRGPRLDPRPRAGPDQEAEAMGCAPDAGIAEMAELLARATGQIDAAIGHLGTDEDRATAAADAAIKTAARAAARLLQRDGRAARARGHPRAHRPPRALPPMRADRRDRDRRRRANRLRRRQGELTVLVRPSTAPCHACRVGGPKRFFPLNQRPLYRAERLPEGWRSVRHPPLNGARRHRPAISQRVTSDHRGAGVVDAPRDLIELRPNRDQPLDVLFGDRPAREHLVSLV